MNNIPAPAPVTDDDVEKAIIELLKVRHCEAVELARNGATDRWIELVHATGRQHKILLYAISAARANVEAERDALKVAVARTLANHEATLTSLELYWPRLSKTEVRNMKRAWEVATAELQLILDAGSLGPDNAGGGQAVGGDGENTKRVSELAALYAERDAYRLALEIIRDHPGEVSSKLAEGGRRGIDPADLQAIAAAALQGEPSAVLEERDKLKAEVERLRAELADELRKQCYRLERDRDSLKMLCRDDPFTEVALSNNEVFLKRITDRLAVLSERTSK